MKNKGNIQKKVVPVHSTHRNNVHHPLAHQSCCRVKVLILFPLVLL